MEAAPGKVSTTTLTSLALLKVNVDQRRDYLDYLTPFVLEILIEHGAVPIGEHEVAEKIRDTFGLVIPDRTIQLLLRRLSRALPISRNSGLYSRNGRITKPSPDCPKG